jgi:hypothetical protein
MGEKTRAEGTIANTVRERKHNWPKNAGKMQFFICACGNHGYFSGFFWMRAVRMEQRDILFSLSDSKQLEGDSKQLAMVRSETWESDRWERHGKNWKKESRRR